MVSWPPNFNNGNPCHKRWFLYWNGVGVVVFILHIQCNWFPWNVCNQRIPLTHNCYDYSMVRYCIFYKNTQDIHLICVWMTALCWGQAERFGLSICLCLLSLSIRVMPLKVRLVSLCSTACSWQTPDWGFTIFPNNEEPSGAIERQCDQVGQICTITIQWHLSRATTFHKGSYIQGGRSWEVNKLDL